MYVGIFILFKGICLLETDDELFVLHALACMGALFDLGR